MKFRLERTGEPDGLGRCQFVLTWTAPDFVTGKPARRAQYFFTDPVQHAKELRARGHRVTIKRRVGRV